MTATLTRIRSPRRPLAIDEKEKLLNVLARLVGAMKGPASSYLAYPPIEIDEGHIEHMPLCDEGQFVFRLAMDLLREYGKNPIPLEPMGS